MAPTRGMTLIELLVVMVIIGLVVTAVPRLMGGGAALETRAAARTVAAVLRQARSRAILANAEVVVRFDTEAGAYAVGEAAPWQPLPEDVAVQVETAASEVVADHIAGLRFFADGSASGGRVTLTREAYQYHVMLHWLTGAVDIVD